MAKKTAAKYAKFISENSEAIVKDLDEFNKHIKDLLNRETDELGIVLKCHLIIEHYIDKYLAVAYPTVSNWDSLRLSFNQKIEFINERNTPIGLFYPSLKCLNTIRNRFAHKISHTLAKNDYKEIVNIMLLTKTPKELPTDLKIMEEFTVHFCTMVCIAITSINQKFKELGLSGYVQWVKENLITDEE